MQERVPRQADPKEAARRIETLKRFFGDKPLSFVNGKNCRAYIKAREPAKPQSVLRELAVLSAAINLYDKEYRLDSVPKVTKPQPAPPREGWLTEAQAAALLRAAHKLGNQHLARFILIAVYSGTRTKAILGLRWLPSTHDGWIDVDAGILYRRGTQVRETKKRTPPARLHARLLRRAKRWRTEDEARGISHVIHYNGEPVEKLRRSWDTACKAAGISEGIVKHSLRHTAATWLMQAGVDKWEACGYLGMTLETLETVYGHHHPDFQSKAAGFGDKMATTTVRLTVNGTRTK